MTITFRSLAASVAACCLLPLAPAAQAEVVKQDEDGFVTRDTATVAATPEETWQALIAPGKWWNDGHTWSGSADTMYISAQAGGCFCELFPEDKDAPEGSRRGSVQHMVVLMANPNNVLRMRGGLGPLQSEPVDGVLTVTLKPVDGGTRILWEYVVGGYMRFKVGEIAPAVDMVMSQQLRGLAVHLGPLAMPEGAAPDSEDAGEPAGEAGADAEEEAEADVAVGKSDTDAEPEEPKIEIEDVDDVMSALDKLGASKQDEPPVPR
ncbi:MAG: SRPBCC family protein [Sphingomonadaceae bacterium]|nr:SRPBCC family protein [Sphingomonadaceae bacterium]